MLRTETENTVAIEVEAAVVMMEAAVDVETVVVAEAAVEMEGVVVVAGAAVEVEGVVFRVHGGSSCGGGKCYS